MRSFGIVCRIVAAATLWIGLVVLGCGAGETSLTIEVEDSSLDEPLVMTLEHATVLRIDERELPGGTVLPAGVVYFVGETPDVCGTLNQGFKRSDEYFVELGIFNNGEPTGPAPEQRHDPVVKLSGPDDDCRPWATAPVEFDTERRRKRRIVTLEASHFAAERGPWVDPQIHMEGTIVASDCPGDHRHDDVLECGMVSD